MFEVFLLESFGHDPTVEAPDTATIAPTYVPLHGQRSIMAHPPKGLVNLQGFAK